MPTASDSDANRVTDTHVNPIVNRIIEVIFGAIIVAAALAAVLDALPPHLLYSQMPRSINQVAIGTIDGLCGSPAGKGMSTMEIEECLRAAASSQHESLASFSATPANFARLATDFGPSTRLIIGIPVDPTVLRGDETLGPRWTLRYWIATESRVCIGSRCQSKLPAGAVEVPLSHPDPRSVTMIWILPDPLSLADARLLDDKRADELLSAPAHVPQIDRGFFLRLLILSASPGSGIFYGNCSMTCNSTPSSDFPVRGWSLNLLSVTKAAFECQKTYGPPTKCPGGAEKFLAV